MEEMTLEAAMMLDKLSTAALLAVASVVLWRRTNATTDKLVATLEGQTAALGAKLAEVKGAVETGLAGLGGRVDKHERTLSDHARRLDEHGRALDRHAVILETLHSADRSGLYSRPRLVQVAEEEEPR